MVDLRCSLSMRPLTVITWCGNAAPRVALATGGRQGSAAATSQAIVLTPGTPRLSAALCRVRQGADDARAPDDAPPLYPQARSRAAVAAALSALARDGDRATAAWVHSRRSGCGGRRKPGGAPGKAPPRRASPPHDRPRITPLRNRATASRPGPRGRAGRSRPAMYTGMRATAVPASTVQPWIAGVMPPSVGRARLSW
jgi:hypothetical protein